MPIYEYFCSKCKLEFELRRSFSEAENFARCPKCNSRAQKLVSGFASKTGNSLQPPGRPFRKAPAAKATRTRGKK